MLDALGYGPTTTLARTVLARRELNLLAYQPAHVHQPALLVVPAPIKAAYIWDLAPGSSVVEHCLAAGLQVYLAAWRRPQAEDATLGLRDYADHALQACTDAIAAETGASRVFLAGHSLGGTFAAIFASLHPHRVRGLIELEGPMAFGAGPIEAALAHSPAGQTALCPCGNVPGTYLGVASAYVDPVTFETEPWLDWLRSQSTPAAHRLHWRVRRWSLDESPMSRRLFEDVAQGLYRENRFAQNRLYFGDRMASPRAITAPVLAILDPRSRVVPRASLEAYRSHTGSTDVRTIEYCGDVGVMIQHVGVLVGSSAHARVWPEITRWIRSRVARSSAALPRESASSR